MQTREHPFRAVEVSGNDRIPQAAARFPAQNSLARDQRNRGAAHSRLARGKLVLISDMREQLRHRNNSMRLFFTCAERHAHRFQKTL